MAEPADEREETLYCVRDNTRVRAESPQCLHPSSFCEFRACCQIVEAEREARRSATDSDRP